MNPDEFDDPLNLARLYFGFKQDIRGYGPAKYIVALCEALAKERSWDISAHEDAVKAIWAAEEVQRKAEQQARDDAALAKRARNYQKKHGVPPPTKQQVLEKEIAEQEEKLAKLRQNYNNGV